jgi:hypothetical protein
MPHCWLMRIEYWPLRSPFRASSRFEFNAARSLKLVAASRMRNRFSACKRNCSHFATFLPSAKRFVS